jgi:hypothetical protein
MAVARLHFPEVPELLLAKIAARAMQSEGYLKNVELTAKRARHNARAAGREKVTLADVELAISEMLPSPAVKLPQSSRTAAVAPQRGSQPESEPPATSRFLSAPGVRTGLRSRTHDQEPALLGVDQ